MNSKKNTLKLLKTTNFLRIRNYSSDIIDLFMGQNGLIARTFKRIVLSYPHRHTGEN